MKIINIVKQKLFFSFIILSICAGSLIHCQETADDIEEIATEQETPDVLFSYENEDLSNIINQLAALKNVNVIFPPGETLNTKVTLHIEKKIPLAQAWNLLDTLLDVAGFFIVPQGSIMRIVKSGEEISREPMPTYIGVNPDDLPNTDQPIRYLYYLANIKVSDQPENELNS